MDIHVWKKRKFKYIAWGIALVFLMGGVWYMSHRNTSGPQSALARPAVKVMEIARKDMMKKVILSGETVPAAQVDISPKYSGRIAEVAVELGDMVHAGDILLRQDTSDLVLSISQNAAGTAQARADAVESRSSYDAGTMKAQTDYQNALDTYTRYDSLYAQGAVSLQDRDDKYRAMIEARSALDTLQNQQVDGTPAVIASKEAAAAKAEYTVAALEQQREDMTIRAPRDGMIGYRQAETGEWVTAGQKLMSLVDNSHIYVDCTVSEQDVGLVRTGTILTVSIDSLGNSYPGKIIYVSPAVDETARSYQVRISLDTSSGDLRGGMFARTEIEAVQRKQTLYVPKEAVGDDNGKKYVYVIDGSGKASRTYVTIGLSNDAEMEILSGIQSGDRVAVTNVSRLREGVTADVSGEGA